MAEVKLYSVDPGKRYYAWAEWGLQNNLAACGLSLITERKDWGDTPVVIEKPQVYKFGKAKNKDIVDLSVGAGKVMTFTTGRVTEYLPAFWKGQMPKKEHQDRIKVQLYTNEVLILEGFLKTELDHILDAVGIGLFHLGRLI